MKQDDPVPANSTPMKLADRAALIAWLARQDQLTCRQKGGGFFVPRGKLLHGPEGQTMDILDVLRAAGIWQGVTVGGYSVSYTPPGGQFAEKLTFFPAPVDLDFLPLTPVQLRKSSSPEEIVKFLLDSACVVSQAGGGFYLRHGQSWRLQDGSIMDASTWLAFKGIKDGSIVAGYQVRDVPRGVKGPERLAFFPLPRFQFEAPCRSTSELVRLLAGLPSVRAMRNGGFFISRGTQIQFGDSPVQDAVDWLHQFGASRMKRVAGYSVSYTSPESPYKERFYFFPLS